MIVIDNNLKELAQICGGTIYKRKNCAKLQGKSRAFLFYTGGLPNKYETLTYIHAAALRP